MSFIKYFGLFLGTLLLLASCASRKDLVYFQGVDQKISDSTYVDYSPVLKSDDELSIIVSCLDIEAAAPYNLPSSVGGIGANATATENKTYLIASDGTIEFPQLGNLQLAGLTRLQAIQLIKEKLDPFLLNPVVTMNIINFKITILGEVTKPGAYPISNERITLIDALGMSGDMSMWGVRNNVLVIRETESGKRYTRVDLTSADVFDSPVYYLQQNDVIYVEPNKPKINSSATSSSTGIIISVTSLVITVISLLMR